jgi:hypothetical protein
VKNRFQSLRFLKFKLYRYTTADAARVEALEGEKKEQGAVIRELISTAGDLKRRRDWLDAESRMLRAALEEAARRHEEAMAAADKTVRAVRAAAVGLYKLKIQLTYSLKGAWFQPVILQ